MEEIINNLQFTHDYWIILLPCAFMCLDVLTGWINAWKNNQISSSKMRNGLGNKVGELVALIVGLLFWAAFGIKAILIVLAGYVIFMEFVSVAENCDKLGFKGLIFLKDKLNNNNNKGSDE